MTTRRGGERGRAGAHRESNGCGGRGGVGSCQWGLPFSSGRRCRPPATGVRLDPGVRPVEPEEGKGGREDSVAYGGSTQQASSNSGTARAPTASRPAQLVSARFLYAFRSAVRPAEEANSSQKKKKAEEANVLKKKTEEANIR